MPSRARWRCPPASPSRAPPAPHRAGGDGDAGRRRAALPQPGAGAPQRCDGCAAAGRRPGAHHGQLVASWRRGRDSRRKPRLRRRRPGGLRPQRRCARLDTRRRRRARPRDEGDDRPRLLRPPLGGRGAAAANGRDVWRPSRARVPPVRAAPSGARHYPTARAVRLWTTWNEPNHRVFLRPQWVRSGRALADRRRPHLYRRLHNAAYDAGQGGVAATTSVLDRRPVLVRRPAAAGRAAAWRRCASRASWPASTRRLRPADAGPSAAASGRCGPTASRMHPYSLDTAPGRARPRRRTACRSASWPS